MSILVARHGLSKANDRNNIGTLAFASEQAPLMYQGVQQAREMGRLVISEFSVDPSEVVATSQLLRTKQTAQQAGFLNTRAYDQLNEIKHDLNLYELRSMLDDGTLPRIAITESEQTLANPPSENVWVTHGLRIAGLCAVLGVYQNDHLIPRFCEIRELPIDT